MSEKPTLDMALEAESEIEESMERINGIASLGGDLFVSSFGMIDSILDDKRIRSQADRCLHKAEIFFEQVRPWSKRIAEEMGKEIESRYPKELFEDPPVKETPNGS